DTFPPIVGPPFNLAAPLSGQLVLTGPNDVTGGNIALLGLADLEPYRPKLVCRIAAAKVWFTGSNGSRIFERNLAGDTIRTVDIWRRPGALTRSDETLISDRVAAAGRRRADWAYGRQVML